MLSKESEQMELDNVGEPTIQGVNSSLIHSTVTHLMTKILSWNSVSPLESIAIRMSNFFLGFLQLSSDK